ncbi:NUDIX domain-containing protein [Fusibacter bizertensis]
MTSQQKSSTREQWEAIRQVSEALKSDSAVRAIFLKGSLARGEADEHSDVDLYCLVYEAQRDDFLKRRMDYLLKYRPTVFSEEVYFVAPQIVAVFDNALHFDLYTVTEETIKATDQIKVIYDPEDLLRHYTAQHYPVTEDALREHIDSFTFNLLEFEAAYERGDLIWASRLASHMTGTLSIILRHLYDAENAQLGMKRLSEKLDQDMRKKLTLAVDSIGPSELPKGVILLIDIVDELIPRLPRGVQNNIHIDFYHLMSERMRRYYETREGVYGVAIKGGKVAVVRVPSGYRLPGGGIDIGESQLECLKREFVEETGHLIKVGKFIKDYKEYTWSKKHQKFYEIYAHVYEVEMMAYDRPKIEDDHELVWLKLEDARGNMLIGFENQAIEDVLL